MIRPGHVLALVLAVGLAACGQSSERDPADDAARSMLAQSTLFCPNDGFSWEAFETMAEQLGAQPDDGEFKRPPTIAGADIVRERWVALNHLGHRTTVWIGELGPGRYYPNGIPDPVEYSSGLACAVHDPTLSREDAFALWGDGGRVTGGVMTTPDDPQTFIALARAHVNSPPGADFYQDIEMRLDTPENHDGALVIRRRYNLAP